EEGGKRTSPQHKQYIQNSALGDAVPPLSSRDDQRRPDESICLLPNLLKVCRKRRLRRLDAKCHPIHEHRWVCPQQRWSRPVRFPTMNAKRRRLHPVPAYGSLSCCRSLSMSGRSPLAPFLSWQFFTQSTSCARSCFRSFLRYCSAIFSGR